MGFEKWIKGLFRDTSPNNMPKGYYPFGKNGIQYDSAGAIINEPGLKKLSILVPYYAIGIIETDWLPIVFSTNNTYSAIGFLDVVNDVYIPVVNDNPASLLNYPGDNSLIGFNRDRFITGQFQRNYKGDITIAFTDRFLFPMYLNCTRPNLLSRNDLKLFADYREPSIELTEELGGSLPAGSYYVAIGMEKNDGTSAPWSSLSPLITLTQNNNVTGTNDKSLRITVTGTDTSYDFMRVAIISRVSGEVKAVELTDYLPVTTGTIDFIYTGDNLTTDITLESILTPPARYDRVQRIGQLNDYLYLGDLHLQEDYDDLQPWVNLIKLEFVSQLIDVLSPPEEHRTGKVRGMMHGEVYAVYVRFSKTTGGKTKWFNIPGNELTAGDIVQSTEAAASGYPRLKYMVEDTIPYYNPGTRSGGTGKWQNDSETYPDNEAWDSTLIGGKNLRTQPVRHHRMPQLSWCRDNFYPLEEEYGRTKLDLLYLSAKGVRIPDKYQGLINGYELGYAKRTAGNSTINGQGFLMHGVVPFSQKTKATGDTPLYTSGGNWTTYVIHKSDNNYDDSNELTEFRKDAFRIHPFDILFSRPAIEPTYLSAQLKMRYNNINRGHGWIEDGDNGNDLHDANFPYSYLIDYTQGEKTTRPVTGQKLRHITESFYLTSGVNTRNIVNFHHEDTFAGYLDKNGTVWNQDYASAGVRIKGTDDGGTGPINFEEGYLVNLVSVKEDLYPGFLSQQIVSAGKTVSLNSSELFRSGDIFVSDYTFHTYGRHDAPDTRGDGINGKKVIRRIICETAANLALRYEVPGNAYSKWYPHTPVSVDDVTNYITLFDRSRDPNQFGYSKDFNALNDLVPQDIWSPYREYLYDHPYRIHRGGKAARSSRPRAWRTFLPLDYYEMQKNMGKMMNLEGMYDRLIIHMEKAMFYTQDKAKLESDLLSVTLGTGDIFQFEPQEGRPSKLGYAGTQHQLACVKTPAGYMFPDAETGEVFLYTGKMPDIMNGTINTFLREYLDPKGDNPFKENGITIGYDQKFKRLLLTVKNNVRAAYDKVYADTDLFWQDIASGDKVLINGKVYAYQGTNDCPPVSDDKYVWLPADPYCEKTGAGNNTGMIRYSNRIKYLASDDGNGNLTPVSPVLTEPNTAESGQGPYFPPVQNTATCPLPPDVITYQKTDPSCLLNTVAQCPSGYTLSGDGLLCIKTSTTAPNITSSNYCVAPSRNNAYSAFGTRIYTPGFSNGDIVSDTPGNLFATMTTNYWRDYTSGDTFGPMNRSGVWIDSDCNGVKDSLSAGTMTTLAFQFNNSGSARTIYIGVGGDNLFTLQVNNVEIAKVTDSSQSNSFKWWHIFPVQIIPGVNYVNIIATGDGSVNDSIAAIGYDSSPSVIQNAAADGDMNIIFDSKNFVGTHIDIATCAPGYNLDTSGGQGNYICRKVETTSPSSGSGSSNTGYVHWNTRVRYRNGVEDGTEPNTMGPDYIPDEQNEEMCPPPNTVPPPNAVIPVSGSVKPVCPDKKCTQQGALQLQFVFPAPTPVAMEVYMGQVIQVPNGQVLYVGSEIFTPPAGSSPDTYYTEYGPSVPVVVTIPKGVTSFLTAGLLYQRGGGWIDGIPHGSVVCHSCQMPVKQLYFKLNDPSSGYSLTLSSADTKVIVNNV